MFNRIFVVLLLGFSSGLPFSLVGSTLQAWYADQGLPILTIGLLGLVGQPYVFRFLWAPLMDRFIPNRLGRRRGWILIAQGGIVGGLLLMSMLSPQQQTLLLAFCALGLAFLSASQDIAIDAYRTEILKDNENGLGASAAVLGYRVATLLSGGLSLIMAQYLGWGLTYQIMALIMLAMLAVTYFIKEPSVIIHHESLTQSLINPFKELLVREKGLLVLVFIFLYKLGEAFTSTSSGMVNAFLLQDLHFDLATVGLVNKVFGISAIMLGSLVAGFVMLRLSLFKALLYFGLLQAVTNILFIVLAANAKSTPLLVLAVVGDNLAAGMGTTAIVAFMMWWINKSYTASQFALLSAIAALPRVIAGPITGLIQPAIGWVHFFELAFLLALPCLLVLIYLRPTLLEHLKFECVK
jgi:PAT family beta-lactamase induction signal transducer AmpG